ncbi:DUF6318 family protein [Nocardioides solisilvae]|uniref:DUF6318 family protein n=1 Tax=Nocardioides solisilvae TaxID=1542435 RepID=UPI0013A555EE|nr:DUF6318 family protein [Nocardioides solisilvae]
MRTPHTSLATALVAVSLAVSLTGCSADAEPEVRIADPSPSASAGVPPMEAPTLPADVEGTGPRAAEAFVRHYVDLINYSFDTLDTGPLRDVAHRLCLSCDGGADFVDRVRKKGGTLEGGHYSDLRLSADQLAGPPGYDTRVRARMRSSVQQVDGTGTNWDGSVPGGPVVMIFDVVNERGTWMMLDWWTSS